MKADPQPGPFFPPDAKRAYQGGIFEVWKWEQKLFDGSVQIFEGLRRRHTAKVIAAVGDRIIVTEEEQPRVGRYRSLPGGMIDDGISPLDQAKHELLEETGYASDDWVPWISIETLKSIDYTVHYFLARDCRKTAEPHPEPGERLSPSLLSFDDFLLLSDDPNFVGIEIVNQLLRMRLHPEERAAFQALLFPRGTIKA